MWSGLAVVDAPADQPPVAVLHPVPTALERVDGFIASGPPRAVLKEDHRVGLGGDIVTWQQLSSAPIGKTTSRKDSPANERTRPMRGGQVC
jgi:hypothetical protein